MLTLRGFTNDLFLNMYILAWAIFLYQYFKTQIKYLLFYKIVSKLHTELFPFWLSIICLSDWKKKHIHLSIILFANSTNCSNIYHLSVTEIGTKSIVVSKIMLLLSYSLHTYLSHYWNLLLFQQKFIGWLLCTRHYKHFEYIRRFLPLRNLHSSRRR